MKRQRNSQEKRERGRDKRERERETREKDGGSEARENERRKFYWSMRHVIRDFPAPLFEGQQCDGSSKNRERPRERERERERG